MFKTLTKYSTRTAAKVANSAVSTAKATPNYVGQLSEVAREEWKKGYIEQQNRSKKK